MLDRSAVARNATEDSFERYGLRRLINASSTEAIKGTSPVYREVVDAVTANVLHAVGTTVVSTV